LFLLLGPTRVVLSVLSRLKAIEVTPLSLSLSSPSLDVEDELLLLLLLLDEEDEVVLLTSKKTGWEN